MAETDRVFAGSIPEIYDRLMVPMLFDSYARDLAERVAAFARTDVLETAAGTGALTRALAARLPASTRLTVTDLNQPMLDRAASSLPGDRRIGWQQADALDLPFADASFDAVACQFGVMFFPDKIRGYTEARRVLKPGGELRIRYLGPAVAKRVRDCRPEGTRATLPGRSAGFHGAHAARLFRHGFDPARTWRCRLLLDRHRDDRAHRKGRHAACRSHRLLPGQPATRRDRKARTGPLAGNHRAGSARVGAPIRHGPDRGDDLGASDQRAELD